MAETRISVHATNRSGRPRRARRAETGTALVELVGAMVVLAIAVLGGLFWIVSGSNLELENRERADANEVMQRLLEEMQDVPFEEVYARFNADPGDDPDGPGTSPGDAFVIEPTRKEQFLAKIAGRTSQDGNVAKSQKSAKWRKNAYKRRPLDVRVAFPVDAQGHLSETGLDVEWSSHAWDLDRDGDLGTQDLGTTYRVLPIRVKLTWSGPSGERTLEHVRLMTRRARPGLAR